MPGFILRRLLYALPLLAAVVVLNFLLIAFTPGDPLLLLVGSSQYTLANGLFLPSILPGLQSSRGNMACTTR